MISGHFLRFHKGQCLTRLENRPLSFRRPFRAGPADFPILSFGKLDQRHVLRIPRIRVVFDSTKLMNKISKFKIPDKKDERFL